MDTIPTNVTAERIEELERALADVVERAAKIAEGIYGEGATWVDREVGADIATRIRAIKTGA